MTGRDALSLPRQIMSSGSALGGWLAALCPGAPLPSNFCLVLSTRRTHGRDRRGGGKKVKDSSWISLSGPKGCGSSEGLLLSMTLPLHGRCSPGLHPWARITPAVLLRLAHVRGISTLANELPSDYPNSNATELCWYCKSPPAVIAHMLICELLNLVFLSFSQSSDSCFFQVKFRWYEN